MYQGIELFFVTGVFLSSMIACHCSKTDSVLIELLFFIAPQYIVIVWPQHVYCVNILLLSIASFFYLRSYARTKKESIKAKIFSNEKEVLDKDSIGIKENNRKKQTNIKGSTKKDVIKKAEEENIALKAKSNYYSIFNSLRSYMLLMVIISILACDFKFFPSRFYKTEFYGYSLMDIGIGAFLVNSGFMSYKKSFKTMFKASATLFFWGLIRLIVISTLNYSVNVAEYGKHLNFYFVLSISNMIFYCINTKHNFRLGLIISLVYEYFLVVREFNVFIFQENRNTLFLKNKEGVFQIIPSLCILLFSSELGKLAERKVEIDKFKGYLKYTLIYLFSFFVAEKYSSPSRRLGNLTYVMYIMALHSLQITLMLILNCFFRFKPVEIHRFVSKNMWFLFLWANLLVLFTNCFFNCNELYLSGHLIMFVYILLVFPATYYLKEKIIGKIFKPAIDVKNE